MKRMAERGAGERGLGTSSELIFYQGEDGRGRIQVRLEGGTVWLTQRLLGELFEVSVPTVNEHLTNIFEEGEADPGATLRKFRIVRTEGNREVSRLGCPPRRRGRSPRRARDRRQEAYLEGPSQTGRIVKRTRTEWQGHYL